MTRATGATVCVVAGDDRRVTKSLLARLAGEVGEHDNVLVVGASRPSPDDPAAWRLPARGDLQRCAGPAAPRLRPIVVFVEDRVELGPGLLDQLVDALGDDSVGAVAPRTNIADGDELYVGVPYRPDESGIRRSFVRGLASSPAQLSDAELLAGPCIAVRRDRLEEAGGLERVVARGFDPATLSGALRAAGLRLGVLESAYVHHRGGSPLRPDPRDAGRPLVTACLIVKDEHDELPRCLDSLGAVADEIVVYDTGSTDDTIEIARRAGARVLEGYWDDDFGRARNDALEACRGQWILWVDADESLVCSDPAAVRLELAGMTAEREAFVVHIENLNGNEAASTFVHPACRLFRRAVGHWDGRLHELVVARAGERELARELTSSIRITHRGYLQSHITGRDKAERNIRTAFADLAGDSDLDWGIRLASLGRSYVLNGRLEEGLEHCRRAADVASLTSTARLARRTAANCLVALGRPAEALDEIARLRAISSNPTLADALAGSAYLALGEHERALEHFERVKDAVDEDGFEYTRSFVAVPSAEALVGLGRPRDAADVLLASIRESGGVDTHVGLLVECEEKAGRDLAEVYEAIGADRVGVFVPQLLQLQPDVSDRTLDAWHRSDPGSAPVLAAAAQVSKRLDISRQLVWSSRLRAAGLAFACPLVATATDAGAAPRDRVLASAAAVTLFGDARARLAFSASALCLAPEERATVSPEVAAIAPGLAERFARLEPAAGTEVPRRAGATLRCVLVVDHDAGNPRTTGVALELARAGHHVTLLEPEPTRAATDLLARRGVTLRGWVARGNRSTGDDASDAASSIARCAAEAPFDTVVVSSRAVASLAAARAVLPTAALVVDAATASTGAATEAGADLVLCAGTERVPARARSVVLRPDTAALLGATGDTALSDRAGLCVLARARDRAGEEIAWFDAALAPSLATLGEGTPVVMCGDDPERHLSRSVPSALLAGAVVDPTPWLRSVRVALVPFAEDADAWSALAEACGTPVLVLHPGHGDVAGTLGRLHDLLERDDLWAEAASEARRAPRGHLDAADPLAALDPPWRRAPVTARGARRPHVRVTGEVFGLASLAQMNRELLVALDARGDLEVSACTPEHGARSQEAVAALGPIPVEDAPGRRRVDLEIRHQWPPDFTPVRSGRLVCMQPWEFGGLPAEWIAPLRDVADELWVPTSWVRECAVRSGVPAERVHVVPYGVDIERFRPDGPSYALRTAKRTKLLFVGGLIERKGVDALLESYLSAFSCDDDVCLVVKPFGSDGVYRTSTLEREVRAAAAGSGAEIEVVDENLDFASMASLYRSCDALVHPYRGEGFGMPIAEAMASGLPVVVTDGGAAKDFCDDRNAWLVAARQVPVRPGSWTLSAAGAWWLEPSRSDLVAAMRAVVDDPGAAKLKGAHGRRRIVEEFTWRHAADRAAERIAELLAPEPARSAPPASSDGGDASRSGELGRELEVVR